MLHWVHTYSQSQIFQTAWICYSRAERILPFSALLISFHQLMRFFSSVLRDVSAGSTDLLEPLRVFKATQGVGELLKGMWFNLDNLR